MPNLVGLNYRDAISDLILLNIIPNDGSVVGKPTAGYFSVWPIKIDWQPGVPVGTVSKQYPDAGWNVGVSDKWGILERYNPPITLTVNAPKMAVSGQFTAGGFA